MTTSIIIPTIEARPDLLQECLIALEATAPGREVVIANDKVSFAENCNAGAFNATGDIYVFLNDDCLPTPGWLEPLEYQFGYEDVGIAGSMLRSPKSMDLLHAGVMFTHPGGVLTAVNITDPQESGDVDAVTGACLAIRASLFHECEGFDTGFVNGYEDVDLCLRVKAGGWRIRYCAESILLHHESASGEARWTHVAQNIQRLQDLWNVSEHPVD